MAEPLNDANEPRFTIDMGEVLVLVKPLDLWETILFELGKIDGYLTESRRGVFIRGEMQEAEVRRRGGYPEAPPPAYVPIRDFIASAQEDETDNSSDDWQKLGAPRLDVSPQQRIVLNEEPTSSPPIVNPDRPTDSIFDQLKAYSPQEVVEHSLPPPPPESIEDYIKGLMHNKPQLGREDPSNAAPRAATPATVADPVDICTGTFTTDVVDITVPTPHLSIAMSRSYRSGRPYFGPFGYGWDHSYNVYLRKLTTGGIALWTGQLREEPFQLAASGGWEARPGFAARLERTVEAGGEVFTVHLLGGLSWRFAIPAGWSHPERIPLTAILDRHGNSLQLAYNSKNQLDSVLDESGRGLYFFYGSCELLERVTDHTASRQIQYFHDSEIEHLVQVKLPPTAKYADGVSTIYDYDTFASHPAMRHNILRIRDSSDRLVVENEYAGPETGWEFNSVIMQRQGGFETRFEYQQIQYVPRDTQFVDVLAARTIVFPPDGSSHVYTFNYRGDLLDHRFRLIADGSNRVVASQWSHDAEGNLTSQTGPDGLRIFYTYDSTNPDPCARRNLLRVELAAPTPGVAPSRMVFRAEYEPRYQLPIRTLDERGAATRFFYDFDDSPINATGRLLRVELPEVVTATGQLQQSVSAFEYNARGQCTAIIRPEGGRTERIYYAGGIHQGFLAEIVADPAFAHLTVSYQYDVAGFPQSVEAPGGRGTSFVCNGLGQIEESISPEIDGKAARVRRWFDDSGMVVRQERPAGSLAGIDVSGDAIIDEFERDEVGNVTRVTLASNTEIARTSFRKLDHAGRVISHWDSQGVRTDCRYGENGALLQEIAAVGDPAAVNTSYAYNRAGQITRMVGAWLDTTEYTYDLWGRLHSVTLPSGAIRTFNYGPNDLLLEERIEESIPNSSARRLLKRSTFEYDLRGRRTAATVFAFREDTAAASPLTTRYLYDRNDQCVAQLLPRGGQVEYAFDDLGRPFQTTDTLGNVLQYTYDAFGDLSATALIQQENGAPLTTTCHFEYDARARLIRSECFGRITETLFDDRNLPLQTLSPVGLTNRLRFDALGQVVETVVDPGGLALRSQYEYDSAGRLVRFLDPMDQPTQWKYDVLGRTVALRPPDGTIWESKTDLAALTTEERMPSGNQVAWEYARQSGLPVRMTSIAAPGQEEVLPHTLEYDGLGRVIRATVGDNAIARRYDSLDRLIEETSQGRTVRMEYYDLLGTAALFFPDGRCEQTQYSITGQPTRVVLLSPGDLSGAAGDILLELRYSSAGRLIGLTYGNGVEGEIVYDEQGRTIRIEYQKAGVLLDSCRLRFDESGHRALLQYLGVPVQNTVHDFDKRERLIEASTNFPLAPLPDVRDSALQFADIATARSAAVGAPTVSFQLDQADTRSSVTHEIGGGTASETYVSAPDHRITEAGAKTYSYNLDGHRVKDSRYTYELDALNRVRRIRDLTTGTLLSELSYDAFFRVSTEVRDGAEFDIWFAGSTRIHEVDSASSGVVRQHSPHPALPLPFLVNDASGSAFLHQDEGLSTMCATDALGAVLERHRFDAFGVGSAFGSDGVTPLLQGRTEPVWRAMPTLGTTGLLRTPQRLYDPELGAFTSRDPLLYADSPSPYVFAAHNPVDFADPTGWGKSPLGASGDAGAKGSATIDGRTEIGQWLYEDSKGGAYSPRPRQGDILTENPLVDTGNTLDNYLSNGWLSVGNLMARMLNTPAEGWHILDDRMRRSSLQMDWQAFLDMAPMFKTMGLIVEGPEILSGMKTILSASLLSTEGAEGMYLFPVSLDALFGGTLRSARLANLPTSATLTTARTSTTVRLLGRTPVLSEAPWAGHQITSMRSRSEVAFEITRNGISRSVLADNLLMTPARQILLGEAKYGNMAQMWKPIIEQRTLGQARNYLTISKVMNYEGAYYAMSDVRGLNNLYGAFKLQKDLSLALKLDKIVFGLVPHP